MAIKGEKLGYSFLWLNITQFLGALNDNIFRWLIIFCLVGIYGSHTSGAVAARVGAVFVIPFLIFTALAGKLADRFSKRNIIVVSKAAELIIMLAGLTALLFNTTVGLYIILFMMCTQSAFFGPSKYGIVPELVKTEQLSQANSRLESLTYLAIVIGTAAAPFLSNITNESYALVAVVCVVVSTAGLIASLMIKRTPPAGTTEHASIFFLRDIYRTIAHVRYDKNLLLAVLASAYFMFYGAFMQMNLIPYGIQILNLNQVNSGYLFLVTAVGIGAGSFWAGRLSGRNVEFGIVPLGAIGLACSSIALARISGSIYTVMTVLFVLGVSAGLFIVPLHAFIQMRSNPKKRGQVLAACNFLGWVGVALSAGLLYVLDRYLNLSAAACFMAIGSATLLLAVITVITLPDFFVRLIVVLLTRICYRIKTTGIDNIPTDSGVLLISNHVSYVDALLLASTTQRRIRFIMERSYYKNPWLKPLCKLMRAIPISADESPKKIINSLRQARQAIQQGDIVCIFAEGRLTRTGSLNAFRGGFERIMKGTDYKIIPAYIGGAWGSVFSYYHGKPLSSLPKKFPYPITVHFGRPMRSDSTAFDIRQKVTELSCRYFESLKPSRKNLAETFIQTARRNWHKRCISDTSKKKLNYGQTLTAAIALGEKMKKLPSPSSMVGILLPPSVGAALANIALTLKGKIPVNLNYSVSAEAIESAIKQCGIKCVISSRKFMERLDLSSADLPGLVFIEDIARDISMFTKVKSYFKALILPRRVLATSRRFNADDLATVIFSSGSTGLPKGVMLSHHNIISNVESIRMVFPIYPDDNLAGVLPFFHSFGYTCSLWLPLLTGVSASYNPNPLDVKAVAKSVRQNNSTVLFAPPTFLLNYAKRIESSDFSSIRAVYAGAEKLKKEIAEMFEQKFGITPLEGYGTTELSPVVSLNVPDITIGGVHQIGTKDGTVGHPLPGIAVRIIDPDTNKELSTGQPGLLLIKGPNVMLGYLGMPEQTDTVLTAGWYNTGDIACLDEDGFIKITDRLSRFSKIGGEMVPHLSIEDIYMSALDLPAQAVAVTSIPEPRKGEELVVLFMEEFTNAEKLHEIVSNSHLPNIWKPRRDNYIPIKQIPILGSGKLDILRLRQIAINARSTAKI